MQARSVDLQSHDPRPASVLMAGWGQGLGTATVVSSLPDEERVAPYQASCLIFWRKDNGGGQSK